MTVTESPTKDYSTLDARREQQKSSKECNDIKIPTCPIDFPLRYREKIIPKETTRRQRHKETLKMPHATATFNGKVIAEADEWEYVEGNVYVKYHRSLVKSSANDSSFPPAL